MRVAALALLLPLLATPALAAPARIISGEHEGFTRLVIDFGADGAWALGRSEGGYELRIGTALEGFDTGAVFARLNGTRLAGLAEGGQPGALNLSLGCACHVQPFMVAPGVLALDIKDGPAPEASPYERPLPAPEPPAEPEPEPEPASAPAADNPIASGWVARSLGQRAAPVTAPPPAPVSPEPAADPAQVPATPPAPAPEQGSAASPVAPPLPHAPPPLLPDPALMPLRDALVREISRGAARGVVTMELPEGETATSPASGTLPDQARIALGEMPQVRVEPANEVPADLASMGAVCPTDAQLDIGTWGDARPVWEQISEARAGLTGEFDRIDQEALTRAVRFHIYIGFGQEALSMMEALGASGADRPLWSSLAHILEGIPDPAPAFRGLAACESAAALWAFMADPAGSGASVNLPALQRSFSALPPGLRQTLGPPLIENLLAAGEEGSAAVVANAIRRPGITESRDIALMDAGLAASAGDLEAADALLRPLLEDPGPNTAEALVVLIEGQAERALPLSEDVVAKVEAFAAERRGGPEGGRFDRALVLALALAGQPGRAFAEAPEDADLQADLWRILSELGTDDHILELAAIAPDAAPPAAASGVALRMAARFLGFGLPDQAEKWLAGAQEIDRVLAARVALAQRDGLSATRYLEGIEGAEAGELRLAALMQAGTGSAVAAELRQNGRDEEADAALARAGEWDQLSQTGQPQWQAAARAVTEDGGAPAAGPLAEGAALADRAAQTREAVEALLTAVPQVKN